MAKRPKRPTLKQKQATGVSERDTARDVTEGLLFDSPESSTILGGSYDPTTSTLTVRFVTGKTYDFGSFPLKLWREFYLAASKGSYFGKVIRPMFAGVARP